tara:strand:+ start:4659 stop:6758 length:2100 start_codon:yes stop_codon:yes gene_type:complete
MSKEEEKDLQSAKSLYIDMNDKDALEQAAGNLDSYQGMMTASASSRTFLNMEPGISVRDSMSKKSYYGFRPGEEPATQQQEIIERSMKAYEQVGIIKNVIDLMGDFGSQGISLVHTDSNAQKFYRRWWEEIGGSERSERFLNTLFRTGNVIVRRRYVKLTKKNQRTLTKGDDDLKFLDEKMATRRIPFVYNFINPTTVEVEGGDAALFSGNKKYFLKLSKKIRDEFKKKNLALKNIPADIKRALANGDNKIELKPETIEVFHYKKDDWQLWAYPMINPILDDITMLEKMKLADMSALDGAISNIRLWRLGDLEHKILPTKPAIDKLRDVLATNVGGGTMDLVWGPEIDFKESNSQVYKFLGDEKYGPVLNSIYAGLGIPPTLTGIAGQSGGFTNNFISLKTLIERLEYGRNMLAKFWNGEIRKVQKAMGFKNPAYIHFDHMILSDDSSEKALLIQLADRDVISLETVRERFGENEEIETARVKKEAKARENYKIPPKAGPYHNAQQEDEFNKIALNKDQISIDQVSRVEHNPQVPPGQEPGGAPKSGSPKQPSPENGRPKNAKDTKPRKQRRVNPRTKPGKASALIWATSAQKKITDALVPSFLAHCNKKNLRTLTKAESHELEMLKLTVLAELELFQEINDNVILDILDGKPKLTPLILSEIAELKQDFFDSNSKGPSVEEMRQIYCFAYVQTKSTVL